VRTITVFTSVNSGPARVSLGFFAVTVPTYTPGADSALRLYRRDVGRARLRIDRIGHVSQGASEWS